MKPGPRSSREVPGPDCLVIEVRIGATLASWGEAEEGSGMEQEVGERQEERGEERTWEAKGEPG